MPGLVTVGHATLCQRLWGQHRSAGGEWRSPPRHGALLTLHPTGPAPTLLQRAQRGANLFS